MVPRYQATLWNYAANRPAEQKVEMKIPLEYPGQDPADRVFGLLVSLRGEVATLHASDGMPETDLPHHLHPPDLSREQERGYRLLNRWATDLLTDKRVDDAWLERRREAEQSTEYDQYFTVEIITLHVEVGPYTIRLTPDGSDEVVANGDRLWSGNVFGLPSHMFFRDHLEILDYALVESERGSA